MFGLLVGGSGMNGQEKNVYINLIVIALTNKKIKKRFRQVQLKEEEVKLKEADQATTAMLSKLEVSSPAVPQRCLRQKYRQCPPKEENGGDVPTYVYIGGAGCASNTVFE